MKDKYPFSKDLSKEIYFKVSRSSGPGGQNVNKLNTKVELRFNVNSSHLLSDEDKEMLNTRLGNKITLDGELIIISQTERSQLKNKEKAIEKFYSLLKRGLTPVKKRKATKPGKASKEKRIKNKRIRSEQKSLRKNLDLHE